MTQDGTENEVLIDATDGTVFAVQTESGEQEQAENEAEDEKQETGTDDADRGNETGGVTDDDETGTLSG